MSEKHQPEQHTRYMPITERQKSHFVEIAREKAPYEGESIDITGSYSVQYETGNGFVDIYIPTQIGVDLDEEDLQASESLMVCVREEEKEGARFTILKTRSYIVYLETGYTDFEESSRVFDHSESKWLEDADRPQSLREVLEYMDVRMSLGVNVFTQEKYEEVMSILNSLELSERT